MIRKLSRAELESEPHGVLFKDIYPWSEIDETPFGSSLAFIEVGGRTMLHSHDPAETFIICRGTGTISIDGRSESLTAGDVVYLPPGSVHELRNDSPTDELAFVSVFWNARVDVRLDAAPRLLIPSPPTPNGPLHLGHLCGPYLLADAMRRYYRAHRMTAQLVYLSDDHQSYVAERAAAEGRAPDELASEFGEQIQRAFVAMHAEPDIRVSPSRDPEYRDAVRVRFAKLVASGRLEEREANTLYCEKCQRWLYDSWVMGTCGTCGARTCGSICECGAPNDAAELADPRCETCGEPPAVRTVRRLFFPVRPFAAQLVEYHRRLRLGPKLRRLAAAWLEQDFAPAASQVTDWGILADGVVGQRIAPFFEVALAQSYLRERYAPGGQISCCFGYDNAYLYLVQDPAVAFALGAEASLPAELGANEFLLYDGSKMSTSRQHGLEANSVLARVPADLLRLYLAKLRPEDAPQNVTLPAAHMFMTLVSRHWQGWLGRLGGAIASETGGRAPEPANASLVPWPGEQQQFFSQLRALALRANHGYAAWSLKEASIAIHELVDRAVAFGAAQGHLAGVESLATERATGLALELAAARTLAMIVSPIMPAFAQQLWIALGDTGPIQWDDDIVPVPPGRPIELASAQFFPASFDFTQGG
jgi:methionyl-tRNA synthetase